VPYRKVREFHQAGTNVENAVYSNVGSGRICYAAKTILTTTWIIFIGIPSNMAEYNELSTGRIQVFIDLLGRVLTRLTGGHPRDFSIHANE
jgi:hypothetical protein